MTVYTHPGQPQMQVEIILASRSACDDAPVIYTIRMRYPRIIHGEIMTHRVFSRNARSSRAVPVKTMLLETAAIPFVPWHWGKNQKGMQAGEEHNAPVEFTSPKGMVLHSMSRESAWLYSRDRAVEVAEAMMNAGYHKQIPNRLLEPFSWIDTLVTSTDWANFLHLRDHGDAEPHLQDLARLVKQAIEAHTDIQVLKPGEWHTPYVTAKERADFMRAIVASGEDEGRAKVLTDKAMLMFSAARSARISYKPFDGDASYEKETLRYEGLVTADRVHASPLEHQATPASRHWVDDIAVFVDQHLSGNLGPGWIQARKLVPNEAYHG